ncbi:hypothetical protein ACQCVB_04985 [Fictibacillus phosphorivorans]|uniref:hypothetical protein n=1 Tax=Fictibacillus phosphorivorans TaxID=1221500 RepID=UPI003CEA7D99
MKKRQLIELRNSLRRRGFWIDIIEGELVLDRWFSQANYNEMLTLLTGFGISVEAGIRGIRVNTNSLVSEKLLLQVETAMKDDIERNVVRFTKPEFVILDGTNALEIFELDYGIASLVFSLNKVGLNTSMSCDGHGRVNPKIWFNGHDQLEEIRLILKKVNLYSSLAYDWDVKKDGNGIVLFGIQRLNADKFEVSKIQDDALSISEFLVNEYLLV